MAQNQADSLKIKMNLKWNNETLQLDKIYHSKSDSLELTTVKFYISGIELHYIDNSSFVQKNSYHLIDIEDSNSLKIPICTKSNKAISKITFSIGVDSLASVSGALSGDLDATKGMYWAWQSGFINMKIEGKSNSCNTRKNEFHFHIGGYLKPYYAMQTIQIPINYNNTVTLSAVEAPINVDLAKLFDEIHLNETNSIMIPGKQAMKIADLSTTMFSVE